MPTKPPVPFKTSRQRPATAHVLLLVLALGMTALYACFHLLPVRGPTHALRHVTLAMLLFGLYLPLLWLVHHIRSRRFLLLLLGFACLFRLMLWSLPPSMSDDFFRYVWDGRVQAHGYNPYQLPPNSKYLDFLKDDKIHPHVNHPKYRTVYPPIAQFLFLFAYLIDGHSARGVKTLLLLSELCVFFLLSIALHRRQRPPGWILLYAWCPVPILELMLEAHVDGFALPFLLGVLLTAQQRRPWLCGVMLACATMIKPMPLFIIPALAWHMRWRPAFKMAFAFFLFCLLAYLPYLSVGPLLFTQLLHYSRHWHFNGPIFKLLDLWLLSDAIRIILAMGIISVSLSVPFLRMRLEFKLLAPLTAYLLLTPTLYPWYFLWIAVWLALTPMPWLLWLAAALPLAHSVHHFYRQHKVWDLPPWLYLLEFAPLFVLIALQLWSAWRTTSRPKSPYAILHAQPNQTRSAGAILAQRSGELPIVTRNRQISVQISITRRAKSWWQRRRSSSSKI